MKHVLSTGIFAKLVLTSFLMSPDSGTAAAATEEPPSIPFWASAADFLESCPIVEVVTIEIKNIVVDAGTQPRIALSDAVIDDYAETITLAAKNDQPNPFDFLPDDRLPQVFRDPQGRCILADGFHRYGGHKKAKVKEMKVAVREGVKRDAVIFSLGTNKDHGIQRSNKDKDRAAKIALNDPDIAQWSNMEIGRLLGISEFKVRDVRAAHKSPAVRKSVSKSGKVTKIDTSAIGKGKGGGKKAEADKRRAEKAAKKAGVAAPAAPAGKAAPVGVSPEQLLEKDLQKIAGAIGGEAGGAVRTAVHDGSLPLTPKEVSSWASFAPDKIKAVAPLVTGSLRMKPTKAFDFLTSELNPKIVTELHNRAIGSPKGVFKWEGDGVEITVKHIVKDAAKA